MLALVEFPASLEPFGYLPTELWGQCPRWRSCVGFSPSVLRPLFTGKIVLYFIGRRGRGDIFVFRSPLTLCLPVVDFSAFCPCAWNGEVSAIKH